MKVIIITEQIKLNITNKDNPITNIDPFNLTDGRVCIGADVINDPNYVTYFPDVLNLPIIDIDDLLIPDNKLRWLLTRDGNLPLMPENYQTWVSYYKNLGEL